MKDKNQAIMDKMTVVVNQALNKSKTRPRKIGFKNTKVTITIETLKVLDKYHKSFDPDDKGMTQRELENLVNSIVRDHAVSGMDTFKDING